MCMQRFLRILSTQRVCASATKDTIDAACGAASPGDTIDAACVCSGSLGYHQRGVCVQSLLRIRSTQHVCAAAPENNINAACVFQLLRIPSTQRVCVASPEDTINAAYVCSGS
ncbi:hypothetical protein ACOMHN_004633 [Nucella lapillus]